MTERRKQKLVIDDDQFKSNIRLNFGGLELSQHPPGRPFQHTYQQELQINSTQQCLIDNLWSATTSTHKALAINATVYYFSSLNKLRDKEKTIPQYATVMKGRTIGLMTAKKCKEETKNFRDAEFATYESLEDAYKAAEDIFGPIFYIEDELKNHILVKELQQCEECTKKDTIIAELKQEISLLKAQKTAREMELHNIHGLSAGPSSSSPISETLSQQFKKLDPLLETRIMTANAQIHKDEITTVFSFLDGLKPDKYPLGLEIIRHTFFTNGPVQCSQTPWCTNSPVLKCPCWTTYSIPKVAINLDIFEPFCIKSLVITIPKLLQMGFLCQAVTTQKEQLAHFPSSIIHFGLELWSEQYPPRSESYLEILVISCPAEYNPTSSQDTKHKILLQTWAEYPKIPYNSAIPCLKPHYEQIQHWRAAEMVYDFEATGHIFKKTYFTNFALASEREFYRIYLLIDDYNKTSEVPFKFKSVNHELLTYYETQKVLERSKKEEQAKDNADFYNHLTTEEYDAIINRMED